MPSSASESIPYIIEFSREIIPKPQRILDVGVGFGKFGFLIREYYEAKEFNRFKKDDWQIELVGIEIFEPYITELQKIIYNQIIIGDVFEKIKTLGKFDLAFLGDILEHFEKDAGCKLLNQLLEHTQYLLIATPNGFLKHEISGGNVREMHKSGWTLKDFENYQIVKSIVIPRIRKNEEILIVMLKS
jgi:hypothetical protein